MSKVDTSVEINAPIGVVYDRWTLFEEFPRFMEGVVSVEQLDDSKLRWTAEIGGQTETWEAQIATQERNRCIAWHSISGVPNRGTVEFEETGPGMTRVHVLFEWEPQGITETLGGAMPKTAPPKMSN